MREGKQPPSPASFSQPRRILVVDDEEPITEIMELLLDELGYQTETVNDSLSALELFRADPERYDLVITDYRMPKMTGLALAKEILAIRPDVPILLCTGFGPKLSHRDLRARGVKALINKPISIATLEETIQTLLGSEKAKD